MKVFRLSRKKYSSELSGKGAALKGARWNSIGFELIYTASNRSLAMVEVAVHFSIATLPEDFMMVIIDIPNDISIYDFPEDKLPKNWKVFPHPSSTQRIGDKFILDNKFCILRVPSVVTEGDFNLLINPNHTEFKRIKIERIENFFFDNRLIK